MALGGSISITAKVRFCSNATQTVTEQFALSGPLQPTTCGVAKAVMFSTPPLTIPSNLTQTVSFPFTIPKTVCAGTYTITATTFLRGVAVNTSTASLTVAPH